MLKRRLFTNIDMDGFAKEVNTVEQAAQPTYADKFLNFLHQHVRTQI